MKIHVLHVVLFAALISIAGCKKNSSSKPVNPPSHCDGPEILAESVLPDYLLNQGVISVNDALTADIYGNIYVVNSAKDFDPPSSENGISGIMDGYMDKFDADGKLVYSKPASTSYGTVIAVDSLQNVYAGYLTLLLVPYHCIVNAAKYNINGDTVWSKHIYYASDALLTCLGASNSGTLHVAANVLSNPIDTQYYDPTVQVEPGSGNMVYTFDPSGKLTGVKQINLFAGFYADTYQFFPNGNYYDISYSTNNGAGINTYKYNSNSQLIGTDKNLPVSQQAVFYDQKLEPFSCDSTTITKFSTGFAQQWTIKTQPYATIRTDAAGNAYIAGKFNGTVNFDTSGQKILTAKGENDSFLEKFDANGKMLWVVQSLGTDGKTYTGASQVNNFVVTSKNEIFVSGTAFNSKTNKNIHFATLYTQCN